MRIFAIILIFILPLIVFAQEGPTQSITIQRDACFGQCPNYSMTVFSDGTYFWQGKEYVEKKGYWYGKFNVTKFEQALYILTTTKFQKFRDTYYLEKHGCKTVATDQASVQVTIQTSSLDKTIYHYLGCSGFAREAELKNLEKKLDEVFETNKFIGNVTNKSLR